MSWEYKTLDQLGEVSRGRSKHRPRNDPSLFGGDYPFIQTEMLRLRISTLRNMIQPITRKVWHRVSCGIRERYA